jgi:hypothetical protein
MNNEIKKSIENGIVGAINILVGVGGYYAFTALGMSSDYALIITIGIMMMAFGTAYNNEKTNEE